MVTADKKPVIWLGAGGHASVLIDALSNSDITILGVADPRYLVGEIVYGTSVLGADEAVLQYSPADVVLVNGIGMVDHNNVRREVTKKMQSYGYTFLTIVHPKAIVSDSVELGEGVQIMAGAVVQPGTKIGSDSIINTGALVDHDCVIGSGCHICPGVTLAGSVNVGNEVMVGSGSTVLPGIKIGSHSVVGAGSTLQRNVEPGITMIQRH